MKKKAAVKGNLKLYTPAKNYFNPTLNHVDVKITAKDGFEPEFLNNKSQLLLKLDCERPLSVASGETVVLETGVQIDLPSSYRLSFENIHKLVNSGIRVNYLDVDDVVKVCLTNVSQNVYTFNSKDYLVRVYLEPVYIFNWRN